MIKFVAVFFILLLMMRINAKSKGAWLTPSGFLIGIYTLAAVSAIPTLYIGGFTEPQQNKYWFPMFMFLFYLLCYLVPFCIFNECKIRAIKLPSRKALNPKSVIRDGVSTISNDRH